MPSWQNVLEILHKNFLETCPLGYWTKLSMEKYLVRGRYYKITGGECREKLLDAQEVPCSPMD